LKKIRKRLTYANVMSSLAVFLILGGATAFAAVKKIGPNEIKANSIKTGKIVKEAVTAGKIKKNAVTESKIADGAVTTNKIANDAVTGDKVKESTLSEVPSAANASKLGGVGANHYVTPGSTLASGDTEVGVFAASAPTPAEARNYVAFIPKLPAPVDAAHFEEHAPGATSANCPGPRQAAPGFICVYEGFDFETTFVGHGDPFSSTFNGTTQPEGTTLVFATSNAQSNVRGSWAYTAP
jgi:hypothetical protein